MVLGPAMMAVGLIVAAVVVGVLFIAARNARARRDTSIAGNANTARHTDNTNSTTNAGDTNNASVPAMTSREADTTPRSPTSSRRDNAPAFGAGLRRALIW